CVRRVGGSGRRVHREDDGVAGARNAGPSPPRGHRVVRARGPDDSGDRQVARRHGRDGAVASVDRTAGAGQGDYTIMNLNQQLLDGDPVTREPNLEPADAQAIRQRMLVEARTHPQESPAWWWPR